MRRFLPAVLFAMLIFCFLGCSGNPGASTGQSSYRTDSYTRGEYSLRLSYPSGSIDYGKTAEFTLEIEYPEGGSYILLPPDVDNSDKYSNTVITDFDEGRPVLKDGRMISRVVFEVEAWLPGEIVFPSLTVRFEDDLKTDEVILKAASAFGEDEQEHTLGQLYLPEESSSVSKITAAAVIFAAAAAASVFIVARHRKKTKPERNAPPKTRDELIAEFRSSYIVNDSGINIRDAFRALEALLGPERSAEYRQLFDRARFSAESIEAHEGRTALTDIFLKELGDDNNEF